MYNLKINLKLTIILFIAAIIRFFKIGFQGIWIDEIHTVLESDPRLSLKEFNEIIMAREGLPHLYFLICRSFRYFITDEIFAIRMVSAIAGILSVYFMYLLGKKIKNETLGYIAAILVSFHPFLIEHSQDGRSYMLMTLFMIISIYRLILFIDRPTLLNAVFLGSVTGLIANFHTIGVLNIGIIYLILLLKILITKPFGKRLFKFSFLSGIITIIFLIPVLPIFLKMSEIKSHWVQAATIDTFLDTMSIISGYNLYLYLLSIVSLIVINVLCIKQKEYRTIVLILDVWILIVTSVITLKSIIGPSLMLHRYFITLIPAFILVIAMFLNLIKNSYLKYISVTIVSLVLFLNFAINREYYTLRHKSQFEVVTNYISLSTDKSIKKVSNWGWLLSYFFKTDETTESVKEQSLETYIQDMKDNKINKNSFWYIDGGARDYNLDKGLENYLLENFTVKDSVKAFDAWAKLFISKNKEETFIELSQFKDALFDGTGSLILVQNSSFDYDKLELESGKYSLTVTGISLPEVPINNENAHLILYNENQKLGDFYLDNKAYTPITIEFLVPSNTLKLRIEYDNDLNENGLDRNAIIKSIILNKID